MKTIPTKHDLLWDRAGAADPGGLPSDARGTIIPRMNRTLVFLTANPRFLSFGVATAFLSSFGQTYVISLFGGEIRAAFGLSHGDFGAVYAAGTLTSAAILIWAGRKIDDIDLRYFTLAVTLGLAAACAVMAATQNAIWLIGSIFLLRFTGQGLMSHTSATSMARYFDANRGKALSVAGMGYAMGEAIFPLIVVSVIAWLGWRGAWLAAGLVLIAAALPVAFWLLKGQAARHRRYLERLDEDTRTGRGGAGWTRRQMLRDRRFYMFLPSYIAPAAIFTGLFFHQIHLVEVKAWDLTTFAAGYSLYAACHIASVFAAGWVIDRISAWSLIRFYLAPMAAACLTIWGFDDPFAIFVYMVLLGIGSGIVQVTHSAVLAEMYGTAHIGGIKALGAALMVFGSALGPVFMGWLIDGGISFETVALGCAVYAAACAGLVCLIRGPANIAPPAQSFSG